MAYVIAFFVLVFFSIFCGWIVAAMIDEEEARELEELEGEIGEKSLRVQILELKGEIQSLKAVDKILLETIKGNLKSIEILMEIIEEWKNLL